MNLLKVAIKAMGPGRTNQQIAKAEAELGRELPEAYRALLRQYNGGRLEGGVFYMPRSPEHPRPYMAEVLGIMGVGHKVPSHDLVAWNKMFGHRWPAEAMEFASDSLGNGFVVFTRGPRCGEVAFRDHESDELTALTKSMDEFFDHLVPGDAPEVLADFPPVVGHAVKIVRPAKKMATQRATGRGAPATTAAKGASGKKAPAGKKAAPKKGVPKKSTAKKTKAVAKKRRG